jgi:hypothetical protein
LPVGNNFGLDFLLLMFFRLNSRELWLQEFNIIMMTSYIHDDVIYSDDVISIWAALESLMRLYVLGCSSDLFYRHEFVNEYV